MYHISPTVGLLGGVLAVVERTPPPTIVPATFNAPPIPTPPDTVNAPVVVLVLDVVLEIVNVLVVPVLLALLAYSPIVAVVMI